MIKSFFDRITRASLKLKWVTILLTVLVFAAGVVALTQFNRELIPPIEFPQTVLIAFNPGQDGDAMLDEVTIPLEQAVSDIEGVVNVESTTSSGLSVVVVLTEFGMDQEAIRGDIQERIDALDLPADMDPPELLAFSLSDLPIVSSSVSSPDLDVSEIKALVEDEILPQLEAIDGVAAVEVSGGQVLPEEPPPTPVETQEPTQEPTPEPTATSQPTPEPSPSATLPPTETPETGVEALPLPDSWVQAAASQGITLETTADLTPEIVSGFASLAPQLLEDLTPEMLLVMPLDALAALPMDYLAGLDPELQAQLAERMASVEPAPEPLPLPESWIAAAASAGATVETTADLTPEFVCAVSGFAPQLLADLTPEMLLAMPLDALAELPPEYLAGLDPELQSQLAERLPEDVLVTGEALPLPDSWIQAAAAQGAMLETTDDLTPEIVSGIAGLAPQMLADLTPEMLLVMPLDALRALPADYLSGLDPELQTQLGERLAQPEEDLEPVPLPESWVGAGAAQGMTLETTADVTPQFVCGISFFAPALLEDLTPEMLLALPLDALVRLPQDYLESLDPDTQAEIAARLGTAGPAAEAVPLSDSWVQAAASQGLTIATTADLTPELVGGIASFAPAMLEDLTPEMLLAMPVDALSALPEDYLAGLDAELQAQLAARLVDETEEPPAEEPEPTGELPPAWQAAGQSQGIELVQPEDVTPEVMQGISSMAPQMLSMLTPENLRRFSPEVLGWLPQEYIETLDPELQAELDTLAEPVGGLGALAQEAAAQEEELSAGAPELSGAWRQPPPEGAAAALPTFETAADLMTTGFADTAADLLNLLVENAGEQAPALIGDLTPEVIAWLEENEPGFLSNLNPSVLRLMSPEVLSELPDDFMDSLDPELRAELEGIAAGTVEAFIPTDTINRVNGNPSLLLSIYKEGEANTVSVSHDIFDKMEEFESAYPGLSFDLVFEQSSFIEESINGVTREGALGALFAVTVILFFLSGTVNGRYKLNWRSTLVAAVSIPLSIMMAFALLRWLPPLADVVLTPLVEATSGIAILGPAFEIIHHLFPVGLTLNIMTLAGMTVAIGRVVDDSIVVLENIYRHIQRGEDQKKSVLVGTRDVSIAIFASTLTTVVVFLPIGLMGGLVGEFFLPFGIAVTYALMSSFVVAITIVPLLAFMLIRKQDLPQEKETTLQRWYTPILKWSLDRRLATIGIATVLLLGSMYLLSGQPRAFLPEFGEPQISVSVNLPNGTTMRETNEAVIAFEDKLSQFEECCVVQSEVGISGGLASRFMGGGINQSGASLRMGVEDADELDSLTAEVRSLAEEHFGAENVTVTGGALTSSAFGSFGLIASGDRETLVEFNDHALNALQDVEGLTNVSSNLTDTDTILRVDGQPAVRYSGELETEDSLGVTAQAKAALEELAPAGITISEGFETQAQTEGFSESISSILIAIVAVYIVMVFTFRSLVHPFTILFSLPMAMIGVALALWITGSVLGISALVGVMMLVGIVVTNAIVLIDRVQANRKERGMDVREALVEGGRTRLRPILMTAIATILALTPLALGLTEGALIASELAIVVIGGLFTSTLLTLLLVPVMYSILDPLSRGRASPSAADAEAGEE